ncbi:chemosensory receptor B [Elysia marginata]|uniref:Chemosensory receptor B n=1 Tax=Elysia marginata TaxID=1093978 RepID=A0AAV4HS93_9GAST|nr:chemosensory receptor B [Elysia marginata]
MSFSFPFIQPPNVSFDYDVLNWSPTPLHYINDVVSSVNVAVFGFSVMANAIVILVFFKDGFRSTSNISFFSLAIADLLVSILWTIEQLDVHPMLVGIVGYSPIMKFIQKQIFPCAEAFNTIASWITAIITWERLCCIAFPLKVKLTTIYLLC